MNEEKTRRERARDWIVKEAKKLIMFLYACGAVIFFIWLASIAMDWWERLK